MLDPRIAPPLGLLFLVAWAREREGYPSKFFRVIDLNTKCYQPDAPKGHGTHDFSLARCMAEIPAGAMVYGIQLASMQLPHGLAIARALRERDPDALIVCGGSHASAAPEEVAEDFDIVVTQEGEEAFAAILRAVMDPDGSNGTGFLTWGGKETDIDLLIRLRRRGLPGYPPAEGPRPRGLVVEGKKVDPLDQLPIPARDMLDFSAYTRKVAGGTATNIITTRGCPARCNFCQQDSLWGSGLRIQSADRILREVDSIYEHQGIRNLLFLDDSLTARKRSDMLKLCEGLKARGVKWRGWTRADLLSRPGEEVVIQAMADSGCQALCVGVEAGTDKVLKAVGKGTTVAKNRTALRRIKAAGMYARASIMVGNPEETWEDVEALCEFVEEEQPDDWILSSFVPLPGTPSWDHPERYGIILDKEKAKREQYRHFFVVGGDEQSGLVHRYANGLEPIEIQIRHDYVQERLLRTAPRNRIRVTIGSGVHPSERTAA
jgi:radical SAM superfamily enzyme YgiQ (UPF0313 family)